MRSRLTLPMLIALILPLLFVHPGIAQQSLVPSKVVLSKTVRAAVDDALLTDAERDAMRIDHGLFDEVSAIGRASASYALAIFDLNNAVFDDVSVPALIRAKAAYLRGDLHLVAGLLKDDASPSAQLLIGQSYIGLGQYDKAIAALSPLRDAARADKYDNAVDLTAAAEAAIELAALEGRPADDYRMVLERLDRVTQQLDRLYAPALVAQARLLADKDNPNEAVKALHEALKLDPGSSEAWFELGQLALMGYDFASVAQAAAQLRRIQPGHLYANILDEQMALQQKDPVLAQQILLDALTQYPNERQLLADYAAAAALNYKPELTVAALRQFDSVSPGNPLALFMVGRTLSSARQYEAAEQMLRAAIARQPNWPAAHVELGLLLNQAGKEKEALIELRQVASLDPFNIRATNVLKMLEAMATYHRLETEHFTIVYGEDIDAALAYDMPELLERIYIEVTSAFSYQPRGKTIIEIMPNKQWFAVRITGMPDIWTIGASTGPIIAITPPRIGKKQSGSFDWYRVIRHEFVHTVTLEQTGNRIAHWFTEAAAVSQEPGPRDYDTCQLLAKCVAEHELFTLDEINWGFVRPKKPTDRAQAYAQANWMFEYITRRFGHQKILDMLALSKQGVPENEIVPKATGLSADQFMSDFYAWAAEQVHQWGLSPTPPTAEIMQKLPDAGTSNPDKLAELLKQYPDHPDVLQIATAQALKAGDLEGAYTLALRYGSARPVDPWADRTIAELAVKLGRPMQAISHLETLDLLDQSTGANAVTLMNIERQLNDLDDAQQAAMRAIIRQPYDATLRETAATIALQRGDDETALHHLKALTWIEPDRAIHQVRLAALYTKMGNPGAARAAAEAARKIDPNAPVDRFLK